MDGVRQDERRLALDIGERRVGGEADMRVAVPVADVAGAERAVGDRRAVIVRRPEADGDARHAGDRLDHPHQLRRAEHAIEILEARREIGDATAAPFLVGQDRLDDRGVAHIGRLDIGQVVEHDVGEALLLVAGEQAAEDRIAVEARKAPPHEARAGLDQRGGAAVADDGEIESVIRHLTSSFTFLIAMSRRAPLLMRSSQSRTSCGPSKL